MTDPLWPRASAWLAGGGSTDAKAPRLAVLGVPLSQASITPSGAHETPGAVRAALGRYSTYDAEADADLEDVSVTDLGDVPVAGLDNEAAQQVVADTVAALADQPDLLVLVGGDNSITRPALRALAAGALDRAGLLTLDAHHDVRGFHAGPTNGTPVRGLIEDGLAGANVAQVGLGALTNSRAYHDWAVAHGITAVTADAARREGVGPCVERHLDALAARCELIYVDLDVDVLDRAFAPGCPGARPGGFTPAELCEAAHLAGRHAGVAAIDIVEVDATADQPPGGTGVTVDAAAQCLLRAAAGLAGRPRR
jgi:formiminoglutamase